MDIQDKIVVPAKMSSTDIVNKGCDDESKFLGCLSITQSSRGIVVPSGATFMKILLVGAGGAGGDYKQYNGIGPNVGGGGGGGGATYVNNNFAVIPGDTFDIDIGIGGVSDGKNGTDGTYTILQYNCTTKTAKGGKGGIYSSFGGMGGRGGESGGKGKDGLKGKCGTLLGGGEGGKTQVCSDFALPYGVGGNGGFQLPNETKGNEVGVPSKAGVVQSNFPTLSSNFAQLVKKPLFLLDTDLSSLLESLTVTKGDSSPQHRRGEIKSYNTYRDSQDSKYDSHDKAHRYMSQRQKCNKQEVKHIKCKCGVSACNKSCEMKEVKKECKCLKCDYRLVSFPLPDVNPTGNPGIQGYAEIKFYASSHVRCIKDNGQLKVQNIKPCATSTDVLYYVDPNVDVVLVNTYSQAVNLYLSKPAEQGAEILIRLKFQEGLAANITVFSGGTFTISSANPSVTLVFSDCVWHVKESSFQIVSFYPTTQQGPTITLQGRLNSSFNAATPALAISADGNTIAVGQSYNSSGRGDVAVYVRCNGNLILQSILVPSDFHSVSPSFIGSSVALSADGNTLAIGAFEDNNSGAVWIFTRQFDVWTQQGLKLVSTGGTGNDGEGFSVDLSADGNILAVGAPGYDSANQSGSVIIYTRTNDLWTQVDRIVGNPNDNAGYIIRLSADGTTLAIYNSSTPNTSVSIYVTIAGVRTLQADIPIAAINFGFGIIGNIMDLSADGDTLAVGIPIGNTGLSVTEVYIRSNTSVWSLDSTLVGSGTSPLQLQGISVSLSADGKTLAIGGPLDTINNVNNYGSVWIFTKVNNNWVERDKLHDTSPNNIPFYPLFGSVSAISSEGSALVVSNGFTLEPLKLWLFV